MSKKSAILTAILLIALLTIGAATVLAATNTFTGTLTSSNSMGTRFVTGCAGSSGAGTFYYAAFTVDVSQAGDYTYTDVGFFDGNPTTIDGYIGFFPDGGFNPASPTAGCVDAGDDSTTITLGAGRYTMVVTSFSQNVTGTYILQLVGPGEITYAAGADVCPNPLPANSVVRSIPAGAPTFYAPDLATQNNFNLPAGTWWVGETSGDFSRVWIACQAQPVWVPTNAIAP